MATSNVVAVLEVMWGRPSPEAPPHFKINPLNRSGARLYSLLGHDNLVVTNACREVVSEPSERGTPDPKRLARNLRALGPIHMLLVCGAVAKRTYQQSAYEQSEPLRVVFMPHPAARWRAEKITSARDIIQAVQNLETSTVVEISL
jgi:hypothetical protein